MIVDPGKDRIRLDLPLQIDSDLCIAQDCYDQKDHPNPEYSLHTANTDAADPVECSDHRKCCQNINRIQDHIHQNRSDHKGDQKTDTIDDRIGKVFSQIIRECFHRQALIDLRIVIFRQFVFYCLRERQFFYIGYLSRDALQILPAFQLFQKDLVAFFFNTALPAGMFPDKIADIGI